MSYINYLKVKLAMEKGIVPYGKLVKQTGLSRKEVEKNVGGRFEREMWFNRNRIKEENKRAAEGRSGL